VDKKNYEILIRRDGEDKYSAFCPELYLLVKGTSHEGVELKIRKKIAELNSVNLKANPDSCPAAINEEPAH